jgi:DNA polymerase-3 subunit gamma/tau
LAGLTATPPSSGLAGLPATTASELPGTAAFSSEEVGAGLASNEVPNSAQVVSSSGTVRRENPYNLGDLRRVWQEYVASLFHLPAVQALLDGMEVTVDDDHRVQLIVSNAIQEKYTSEHRDSMLQFLRQGLQNDLIDIEVQVSREAAAKVVYTPDERFAYLAEKNPLLHQMREIFQLDIE